MRSGKSSANSPPQNLSTAPAPDYCCWSNGFYLPAVLIRCNIKYIFYDYSALQVKTAVEPYESWQFFLFGCCLVVGLQHALHFPCKYRIVNARMSVCLFSSYSVPFLQVQLFLLLLASVRKGEEGTRIVVVKIRKESRHIAHHGHTQQHNTRCGIISLRTQVFFVQLAAAEPQRGTVDNGVGSRHTSTITTYRAIYFMMISCPFPSPFFAPHNLKRGA